MALDGVVISGIISELKERILGGRIYKIYQPEVDELCIVVKNRIDNVNNTERLLISADASLPFMYITQTVKENPATAPNFCMLLRKHIGNGRITDINQPGFERIIEIKIEHLDEMGDLCYKKLIVEIMGKHSNIIFTDKDGMIIDSIKHISHQISSVREVLPGRKYVYPPSQDKINPLELDNDTFMSVVMNKPLPIAKAIYTSITGFSPTMANEICYRAGMDGGKSTSGVNADEANDLFASFNAVVCDIKESRFEPCIAYSGYEPVEFSSIKLTMYGEGLVSFSSMSKVIEEYYWEKSVRTRIKQKSTDLRKIVATLIERTSKKYDIQLAQLKDTEKRDKYKVYGELITTYGYSVCQGDKSLTCMNYYDNNEITIPLDPDIAVMDNAKKYFAKYNKLKRTYEALIEFTESSKAELDHLLSVQNSLEIAESDADLTQIKNELIESGYIRGRVDKNKNKKETKSKPMHFVSSDGFHMYVGKNNFQNEEITFKLADGGDMWFHAKQMPGSHVIVKTNGVKELPDTTYEEAARLAAFFSSGRNAPKVDIDYTERKNLKKPPKAKPGFVIYHTNYSMVIEPDIHGIQEVTGN